MNHDQSITFLSELNMLLELPAGSLTEAALAKNPIFEFDGIPVRFSQNHDTYYRYAVDLARQGDYIHTDHPSTRTAYFRAAHAKKAAEKIRAMVEYGKANRAKTKARDEQLRQITEYNSAFAGKLAAAWGVEPARSYAAYDVAANGLQVELTRSSAPVARCKFELPADEATMDKLIRIAAILAE